MRKCALSKEPLPSLSAWEKIGHTSEGHQKLKRTREEWLVGNLGKDKVLGLCDTSLISQNQHLKIFSHHLLLHYCTKLINLRNLIKGPFKSIKESTTYMTKTSHTKLQYSMYVYSSEIS